MAKLEIPVNPDIVKWAIDESGYQPAEIAKTLDVDASKIEAWCTGDEEPSRGQLNSLAKKLKRPRLLFFYENVPEDAALPENLRTMQRPDETPLDLLPEERLAIRRARYLQRSLSELLFQDERAKVDIPRYPSDSDHDVVGKSIRCWIEGESADNEPVGREFTEWRDMVEDKGIFVMSLPLRKPRDSHPGEVRFKLRGFSLPDEYAPVIATISVDYPPARSFTIFHELAHLVTGSLNSCHVPSYRSQGIERWCDQVASSALIPREDLELLFNQKDRVTGDENDVRDVASRYKTSQRAAAVAIESTFPQAAGAYRRTNERLQQRDRPQRSGGGGGATRPQIRVREYGKRAVRTFLQAFSEGRIGELEIRRKLNLDGPDIDAAAVRVGVAL